MAESEGLPTTTYTKGVIPIIMGLPGLLATGNLADFEIITTSARTIPVHKVILSLHSSVLAKPCNGDFRETSQNFIDLREDDSKCVEAMVQYMYHFNYESPEEENLPADFQVKMAIIADKYDIAELKEVAIHKCKIALSSAVKDAESFAKIASLAYAHSIACLLAGVTTSPTSSTTPNY